MTKQHISLPPSVAAQYTGGHIVNYGGYLFELCPAHPKANPFGFVVQHRLIVERHLGRYLQSSEQIHHIDENPLNNSLDNLQLLSRSDHFRLHRKIERAKRYPAITAQLVKDALAHGGLKAAAKILGCHTETIRNNFPELVEPYKRKSPTRIDDPVAIAKILAVAHNDKKGYREVAKETGISFRTIQRICERNGIPWTRKSRSGEVHRTYRRKTTNQSG